MVEVHVDHARATAGQQSVRAEDRLLNFDTGWQASENNIAGRCDLFRRLRLARAALHQVLDRHTVAIAEYRQCVTLGEDVGRRPVPHQPDTDIANARQVLRHLYRSVPAQALARWMISLISCRCRAIASPAAFGSPCRTASKIR